MYSIILFWISAIPDTEVYEYMKKYKSSKALESYLEFQRSALEDIPYQISLINGYSLEEEYTISEKSVWT